MKPPKKKSFLGDFELTVLLAVLRLDEDAYGGAILREIDRRTGREVAGGAQYVTLDRMEAKGLTDAGFEAVRESRQALLNLMLGLDPLFR
jgi:DNA-binding PadR family transcriptional regulator